ncbi:unnamed protein product [Prunus armeniaca]
MNVRRERSNPANFVGIDMCQRVVIGIGLKNWPRRPGRGLGSVCQCGSVAFFPDCPPLTVDTTFTRFTICLEIGNFLLEKFCRASRVQKTLQVSSDNIGWLPGTPGMPGVEDGTAL